MSAGLCFLDTNIIIRHVTGDSQELSQKARRILKRVESGKIRATTSESVIAECVFVLSSRSLYNLPRPHIRTILTVILSFKGLKLPYKRMYKRALDLYVAHSFDFADALFIAHMERQHITDIYSFDRDFDRVEGVKRRTA